MNLTTSYGYDALARLVTTESPMGNVSTNVYDAADRLIANVDPNNARTSYGYDALNRQVTITAADSAGSLTHSATVTLKID